jgi:hypothetical protein
MRQCAVSVQLQLSIVAGLWAALGFHWDVQLSVMSLSELVGEGYCLKLYNLFPFKSPKYVSLNKELALNFSPLSLGVNRIRPQDTGHHDTIRMLLEIWGFCKPSHKLVIV